MMRTEKAILWSGVGERARYAWVVAATLMILLVGALAGLPVWAGDSRGLDADAARYQAMGESFLARSEAAQSERWSALGRFHGQGNAALGATDRSDDLAGYWSALEGAQTQGPAALASSGESASLAGYWSAVAAGSEGAASFTPSGASMIAVAEAYTRGLAQTGAGAASAAPSGASMIAVAEAYTRGLAQTGAGAAASGLDADAARYQAMGAFYLAAAERGIDAGAARYAAMGTAYQAMAADAEALAANPELRLARAGYAENFQSIGLAMAADAEALAANPELRLARAGYTESFQSIGSCVRTDPDRLAANPELLVVRISAAC